MQQETHALLLRIPLILGGLSCGCLFYWWIAKNLTSHLPGSWILAVMTVSSAVGIIISIITRNYRKQSPLLWYGGFILSLAGILFILILVIYALILLGALMRGDFK